MLVAALPDALHRMVGQTLLHPSQRLPSVASSLGGRWGRVTSNKCGILAVKRRKTGQLVSALGGLEAAGGPAIAGGACVPALRGCRSRIGRPPAWRRLTRRGHDNLPISAALASRLDALDWRPRVARGAVGDDQAQDMEPTWCRLGAPLRAASSAQARLSPIIRRGHARHHPEGVRCPQRHRLLLSGRTDDAALPCPRSGPEAHPLWA
jgi:hypothetical protein